MMQDFCERWGNRRLASLFSENKNSNTFFRERNALQFKYGNIVAKKQYELTDDLVETYRKYTIVQPGDIMINGLNLNYDFVTQRVAQVSQKGIITSAYIALSPHPDVVSKYYLYYFKALDSIKAFNGMGTGIRLTLSFELLKSMRLPVPPREEQDQIVRFLDWKVSSINNLINIKRKEIDEINTLKGTIISHVVRQGLNRDIPMKFSGIEWLGDIPAHWVCTKIKRKCEQIGSGTTPSTGNAQYYNGDINWIQSGDLYKNHVVLSTVKHVSNLAIEECSALSIYHAPFVVVAMYGASVGNAAVSQVNACVNQACCVLIPNREVNIDFLLYWLMDCKQNFLQQAVGGTQPNISQGKIKDQILLCPPYEEQQQIVSCLNQKLSVLNNFINVKVCQIKELQELKTSLISNVVTGKIDVRGIDIPDYEFTEDVPDVDSKIDGEDELSGQEG